MFKQISTFHECNDPVDIGINPEERITSFDEFLEEDISNNKINQNC